MRESNEITYAISVLNMVSDGRTTDYDGAPIGIQASLAVRELSRLLPKPASKFLVRGWVNFVVEAGSEEEASSLVAAQAIEHPLLDDWGLDTVEELEEEWEDDLFVCDKCLHTFDVDCGVKPDGKKGVILCEGCANV